MHLSTILTIEEVRDLLSQELTHDSNDVARKLRYYCEAAAIDNKQATWELITNSTNISLSLIEYSMSGFNQFNQAEVLQPYGILFFSTFPDIFTKRTHEFSVSFFRNLLPLWMGVTFILERLEHLEFDLPWIDRLISETVAHLHKVQASQGYVRKTINQ